MGGWRAFCTKWVPWISLPLLMGAAYVTFMFVFPFHLMANSRSDALNYALLPAVCVATIVWQVTVVFLAILLLGANSAALYLVARSRRSFSRVARLVVCVVNLLVFGSIVAGSALNGFKFRPLLFS